MNFPHLSRYDTLSEIIHDVEAVKEIKANKHLLDLVHSSSYFAERINEVTVLSGNPEHPQGVQAFAKDKSIITLATTHESDSMIVPHDGRYNITGYIMLTSSLGGTQGVYLNIVVNGSITATSAAIPFTTANLKQIKKIEINDIYLKKNDSVKLYTTAVTPGQTSRYFRLGPLFLTSPRIAKHKNGIAESGTLKLLTTTCSDTSTHPMTIYTPANSHIYTYSGLKVREPGNYQLQFTMYHDAYATKTSLSDTTFLYNTQLIALVNEDIAPSYTFGAMVEGSFVDVDMALYGLSAGDTVGFQIINTLNYSITSNTSLAGTLAVYPPMLCTNLNSRAEWAPVL